VDLLLAYSDGLHDHAEISDITETSEVAAQGAPGTGPRTPRRSRPQRGAVRSVVVSAAVAVLAVGAAGCGSSTTPSTTTSASTAGSSSSASPSSSSSSASAAKSSGSGSASSTKSSGSGSASSGPSTSTSYPADKQQVCQARDQLTTSIAALTTQGLLTGGTAAIKAAVDQVQTDLNAVAAAGKQDYQPQVTALQSSLQQLETAVGNLGSGGAAQDLKTVATAIAATATAAGDLFTQLKTACGS